AINSADGLKDADYITIKTELESKGADSAMITAVKEIHDTKQQNYADGAAKFKGLEVGDQKDYKEIYIPLAEAAVKIRAKATKTKAEEDLITLILSRTRDFEPTKKSELEKTIKDLRSYKEGSDTDKKTAYEENIKGEYATQYDQLISKLENKL
ncbi:9405_t:CDS:2, partial [Entrophospora sp. SA101]